MTEACTHVLFEQTERSTVSWQISREGTVLALASGSLHTTGEHPGVEKAHANRFAGRDRGRRSRRSSPLAGSAASLRCGMGFARDNDRLEAKEINVPTTHPGRINAVFADEGNTPEAVFNQYKAFGGSCKRKDEKWRAPK
jgi:hypothetical protein